MLNLFLFNDSAYLFMEQNSHKTNDYALYKIEWHNAPDDISVDACDVRIDILAHTDDGIERHYCL